MWIIRLHIRNPNDKTWCKYSFSSYDTSAQISAHENEVWIIYCEEKLVAEPWPQLNENIKAWSDVHILKCSKLHTLPEE